MSAVDPLSIPTRRVYGWTQTRATPELGTTGLDTPADSPWVPPPLPPSSSFHLIFCFLSLSLSLYIYIYIYTYTHAF